MLGRRAERFLEFGTLRVTLLGIISYFSPEPEGEITLEDMHSLLIIQRLFLSSLQLPILKTRRYLMHSRKLTNNIVITIAVLK